MNRKAVLAITLTLMLLSMLTLAFTIHLVKAELTDRKVGVSVGYWIQYGISVKWESNDPNATTPQYVLDSQQLVFFSNVVQSVSGTNVTFNRIMLFKNGTEKYETRWIDVDSGHAGTGSASGYLSFIAANLSAGDLIYTGLGAGIGQINETITRTYLGQPVEINHVSETTSSSAYFLYADTYWNRATGVLYEAYMNHTEYTTKGEETYVTKETQWLYPIGIIGIAKTWTVDDDGPADFSSIQEAINAANPEDTIFVHSGTYYENVIVNKAVSLIGENKLTTTIDGNMTGTVVMVTADNVAISGFTIRNGGDIYAGVSLSSNGNNITNNIMSNNWCGISLEHYSAYNIIADNSIMNNLNGIVGELWSETTIINNVLKDNLLGINTNYCDRNLIAFNNITNHWSQGIMIQFSSYNTIVGNYITDNNLGGFQEGGIYIGYSSYNKFFHNNIIANRVKQVEVRESSGHPSVNTWDNGYPSGGNYWSDHVTVDNYSGIDQDELGSDGIVDEAYTIDEDKKDRYPLMEPWAEPAMIKSLIRTIKFLDLPKGTENNLKTQLKVAIHMLDLGKEDGAIRKLSAFINRVEMLREKTLTNEQANELILEAQRIIDLINR